MPAAHSRLAALPQEPCCLSRSLGSQPDEGETHSGSVISNSLTLGWALWGLDFPIYKMGAMMTGLSQGLNENTSHGTWRVIGVRYMLLLT